MRSLRLIGLVICVFQALSFGAMAQEGSTQPVQFAAFYGSSQAYKVTIQTDKGVVSVLDVPKGVFLGIEGIDARYERDDGLPHTFIGDLVVRTRRADELTGDELNTSDIEVDEMMARSNFVLALKDAVVLVEGMGNLQ